MRYIRLALFLAGLSIFLVGLNWLLGALGAPISLRDTRGAGQVGLLALTIIAIMLFVRFVAGINPFLFIAHYLTNWRRALVGFLVTATALLSLSVLLTLIIPGSTEWSQSDWEKLSLQIVMVALANLFAALVLATTEELIFRATIMRYMRSALTPANTVAAVFFSAVLFSISHVIAQSLVGPITTPVLFGLFLLGVLLATVYVATGSITCAIGVHFGLLGFKVILRETDIASFNQDIRGEMEFYVLMVVLTALAVVLRKWLWNRFAVEPAALLDEDVRNARISSFDPPR